MQDFISVVILLVNASWFKNFYMFVLEKPKIQLFYCNAPAAFVSRAWIIKPNLLSYSHSKTQQCTRSWCPAFHLKTRVSHPHQHLMLHPNACPGANWCRNCTAAKAWTLIQTITAQTMHQMQVNMHFLHKFPCIRFPTCILSSWV